MTEVEKHQELITFLREEFDKKIGRIADDVWQAGKSLGGNYGRELKNASSALHDLRREIMIKAGLE